MEKSVLDLIIEAEKYLEDHDFSLRRRQVYSRQWRLHFLPYTVERNLSVYSPEINDGYIDFRRSQMSHSEAERNLMEIIRGMRLLEDIFLYGEWRCHRKKKLPPLDGAIGTAMNDFLDYLRAERRSTLTVEGHHRFLLYFLTYLKANNITQLCEITPSILFDYLSGDITSKKHVMGTLQYVFKYWALEGLIGLEIINVFKMIKPKETDELPDVYNVEEIRQIVTSVERTSPFGIRNYAMLLLAVYYGIRASDIAGLRLEHIHWRDNQIEFIQAKTGKRITLPLRAEVGNALLDYIKNVRRNQSDNTTVFQSLIAPFNPVTNKCVSSTISIIISKSGINLNKRKHGPHSLRSSIASNLLKNNEEYHVISEALGHVYTPTTKKYLRIDITSLLKCALDVPPVPDSFYQQKGGIFYDT